MPIFEYTCNSCDRRFEFLVTGSRTPACPDCGSERLKKELSAFTVVGQSAGLGSAEPNAHCASCDHRGVGSCPLGA